MIEVARRISGHIGPLCAATPFIQIYPNQLSEVRSLDQPDHSFQAYAVSIEEVNGRNEGRWSGLVERSNGT
jgi:hypothetical protein